MTLESKRICATKTGTIRGLIHFLLNTPDCSDKQKISILNEIKKHSDDVFELTSKSKIDYE